MAVASTTGTWRKQSHLGTSDLELGAMHSGRKKEEIDRGRMGCAPQGRAAVRGREKGVIVCAVMRLDLGFGKVRRERKGACLHKIKTVM